MRFAPSRILTIAVVETPGFTATAAGFPFIDNKSNMSPAGGRIKFRPDATRRFLLLMPRLIKTNPAHQTESHRPARESPPRFSLATAAGNTDDFLSKTGTPSPSPKCRLADVPTSPHLKFYSASAHPARCRGNDPPGTARAALHPSKTEMIVAFRLPVNDIRRKKKFSTALPWSL